jgi:hypothetical protein
MNNVRNTAPTRPPKKRGGEGRRQRSRRLPLARQREAVEHGGLGCGRAWNAHEHGRERVRGWHHGHHADHQRKTQYGFHAEHEGQQQRQPGDAAEAGEHADRKPHDHTQDQIAQDHRLQDKRPCVGKRRQGGREEIHRTVLSVECSEKRKGCGPPGEEKRARRRFDYLIVTP